MLKDHLLPGLSTLGVPKNLKILSILLNLMILILNKICSNQKIGAIKMEIFRNINPSHNFLKKVRDLATKKYSFNIR